MYAGFLVLGIFTTDYKDGKAYVVNADVRQERAYIDRLTPFYNVVINTPDAVESLENNTSNSIDLIYKLTKLKDAISSMQKEIKTTKAPEVYTAYQQYLIELSDEETALLQSVIAYHQDPNQDRMPEIQEQLDNVHDGIQNVKNQMNDIQKRLIRNQQ
ncbi:hypothetical protein JK635_07910 [Neobacillus sp. YIM B02564]|uniref:Uncharacterized protein n=1 Tax=Neobacillus paridis TaxID=2803862 RepID=A0ABS1TLG4_9BACI|nr:hypothetical protein [Neobacillus paridis]MBL4952135.1 hypothetical protein [Neobacillus paridis]